MVTVIGLEPRETDIGVSETVVYTIEVLDGEVVIYALTVCLPSPVNVYGMATGMTELLATENGADPITFLLTRNITVPETVLVLWFCTAVKSFIFSPVLGLGLENQMPSTTPAFTAACNESGALKKRRHTQRKVHFLTIVVLYRKELIFIDI